MEGWSLFCGIGFALMSWCFDTCLNLIMKNVVPQMRFTGLCFVMVRVADGFRCIQFLHILGNEEGAVVVKNE